MRKEIVDRITKMLGEKNLDALICLSPENFSYVAGFTVPSQPLMRWRHAAIVISSDGNCRVLSVDMEESTVRSKLPDTTVHVWGEFTDQPMEVLAQMLSEMNLAKSHVGIEMDFIPAGDFKMLSSELPNAHFSPIEDDLNILRQIKTPDEVDLMRKLSRIADQSIYEALTGVSAGKTEMDIAGILTRHNYQLGADNFKLMIVATGERSVYPNVGPSSRILKEKDICRVEIFSMKNGYHAGVCRTAYVGSPPTHAEEIWKNLVECKYLVLDMIKPGASTKSIYEAFIRHLSKLHLPPIKFIGHGIGLHLHEEPYLGMYSDEPLKAGMVLGIEPLVYNTGYGFGMQNKDIVYVSETGAELLSDFTNTDQLIAVT